MLFVSTELDAINLILSGIGEAPVNSLTESESIDVDNARSMLATVSRDIQRQGWQFNTLTNVTIMPDTNSKKIRYNPSWIKITATNGEVYVKRGDFLYNLTEKTDTFNEDIQLTIIEAVDFEDLPDEFKTLITAEAAIFFQERYLGDENVSQELRIEESRAYADIVQYCIDTGSNMFQTTGMQSALERR
jgi:hypothetical protein